MNRKSFIQQCMAASFPDLMDGSLSYEKALKGSERLWERMTGDGLGADQKTPLRERESDYDTMPDGLREGFDKFWRAYGLKKDKEGAARAWRQIKGMDDSLMTKIIEAAGRAHREAQQHDGPRKYPQGWLTDRRWMDYESATEATVEQDSRKMELNTLTAELRALQAFPPSESIDEQIAKVRDKMDAIRRGM